MHIQFRNITLKREHDYPIQVYSISIPRIKALLKSLNGLEQRALPSFLQNKERNANIKRTIPIQFS
jgi:hypothetical protein